MSSFRGHEKLTLQFKGDWTENTDGFVGSSNNLKGGVRSKGESYGKFVNLGVLSIKVVFLFCVNNQEKFYWKPTVILFPKCNSRVRTELKHVVWILRIQMVSKSCMESSNGKYQVVIYGPHRWCWNGLFQLGKRWEFRRRNKYTSGELTCRGEKKKLTCIGWQANQGRNTVQLGPDQSKSRAELEMEQGIMTLALFCSVLLYIPWGRDPSI